MDKIAIVTSLYKSSPFISDFYARHKSCVEKLGLDFEFVFVDDGSPDDSVDIVLGLIRRFGGIKLVQLSRNFGQQAAMVAGLTYADGDYIYAADCDLEELPENIVPMFSKFTEGLDIDVVYGVVRKRDGGWLRGKLGGTFHTLLNIFSDVPIPRDQGWQRIMTKRYVKALLAYSESETLMAGIMAMVGFNQLPYEIEKKYKGSSTYSAGKRFKLAFNSIISYSSKPLVMICISGLILTIASFIFIMYILYQRAFGHVFQSGWLSLIASIWCVGGLMLFSIGIIGIYLAKIFNQVKARPRYLVKSVKT